MFAASRTTHATRHGERKRQPNDPKHHEKRKTIVGYQYRGKTRDVEEEIEPATTAGCGTNSGYMRHGMQKTPRCQPCKDAHAAVNRKRRTTMRNQCATYPGYMRHKRAGEDACDMCREAYARYMADYRAQRRAA
jgi:hypothetical protein